MRSAVLAVAVVALSCSAEDAPDPEPASEPAGFPFEGSTTGKEDVFGRALVGAPNPYVPDPELLADPAAADAELSSDLRQRRAVAWATALKVLGDAPLLGLASQLDARPDCAAGVDDRDLQLCARKRDQTACAEVTSGEVTGVCTWDAEQSRCGPSCDHLSLPDGSPIPTVPRWATWYGVEDINRIFRHAYAQLTAEEQVARTPFSDLQIGRAFEANNSEIDRSRRWPLRRYTEAVNDLFGCDVERTEGETDDDYEARCALERQSQFSGGATPGGGISRLVYSPAMVLHMMRNYGEVLQCAGDSLEGTWCDGETECEDPPENFSTCFRSEFPADGGNPWRALDATEAGGVAGLPEVGGTVVIKATWARVGFGFELPAYDTDADALARRVGEGKQALWGSDGDRTYKAPAEGEALVPGADSIYTIRTRKGSVYRLTGLHIMTKELRHWQWITMWWSDRPDTDFGADRPKGFDALPSPWRNYKLCVVVDYLENDSDPVGRFDDFPTLQAALAATEHKAGGPTWCSNPYIEHGAGNARTNCIGCHQHAGTRFTADGERFDLEAVIDNASTAAANPYPANGRTRLRDRFATDYSWAFSRLDDLTELIRKEVEFRGAQDERWLRINSVLSGEGDPAAGSLVFANANEDETCSDCHGESGEGDIGPPLEGQFASKTEWALLNTILGGRGDMPAWGDRLSDQQLTDLFAWLRLEFSPDP